jgi:hypothetical protein
VIRRGGQIVSDPVPPTGTRDLFIGIENRHREAARAGRRPAPLQLRR